MVITWGGLMELDHDYSERGNFEIFSGRTPCLSSPVCALSLTSDEWGSGHGWNVDYVRGDDYHCGPRDLFTDEKFTIEQWLALDTSPYELIATRNYFDYYAENRAKNSAALSSSMWRWSAIFRIVLLRGVELDKNKFLLCWSEKWCVALLASTYSWIL